MSTKLKSSAADFREKTVAEHMLNFEVSKTFAKNMFETGSKTPDEYRDKRTEKRVINRRILRKK